MGLKLGTPDSKLMKGGSIMVYFYLSHTFARSAFVTHFECQLDSIGSKELYNWQLTQSSMQHSLGSMDASYVP